MRVRKVRSDTTGMLRVRWVDKSMDANRVICIADEAAAHEAVYALLREAGWEVHVATLGDGAALRLLQGQDFPVGLLLAYEPSERLLEQLQRVVEAHGAQAWVGAFGPGALSSRRCRHLIIDHLFDHHTLPADGRRLALTLGHASGHAALRRTSSAGAAPRAGDAGLVGQSLAIATMRRQIQRVAQVDAPVLISGESGSGKELAALAIHKQSARAGGPFISVNCGAIPAALIQSELFGHVRGAFTGADRDKRGLFEAADGGILFLDEIGDLSLELQVNLLRVLQERSIMRVGTTQSVAVDVRIIAATHVDLQRAVAAKTFREDLYYRLNVLPLQVPPLRARRGDIELLARHVFEQYADERRPGLRGFGRRALAAMAAHDWPGNVRELINRVRRGMVMAEGRVITPQDLGLLPTEHDAADAEALDDARTEAERQAIFTSLSRAGQNVSRAARQLGVSRATLYRLMAKHGLGN